MEGADSLGRKPISSSMEICSTECQEVSPDADVGKIMTDHDVIQEDLLTPKQTAQLLSCSPQHVLRMAARRAIPAIDLAASASRQRMWRFRRGTVLTWIREKEKREVILDGLGKSLDTS